MTDDNIPDHTAFPSKVHDKEHKRMGWEIRRTWENGKRSYRTPGDQPTRAGYETTYTTREKAQKACDKLNKKS